VTCVKFVILIVVVLIGVSDLLRRKRT